MRWRSALLHLLCAALGSLVLGGCGGPPGQKGFFVALLDSTDTSWHIQMRQGVREVVEAARSSGLVGRFEEHSAGGDPGLQVRQFERLVADGARAVLVDAVSTEALSKAAEGAGRRGVLVMSLDEPLGDTRSTAISYDQAGWAQAHALFVVSALGGEGTILRFDGPAGDPVSEARTAAQDAVLAANPGIRVLKTVRSTGDPARARQLASQLLLAFPRFDAILCQGGSAGVYAAFRAAGRRMPRAMSLDGTVGSLRLWHEHQAARPRDPLNGCIIPEPPSLGASGMHVLLRMLRGERPRPGADGEPARLLVLAPPAAITASSLERWYSLVEGRPDQEYLDVPSQPDSLGQSFFP